MPELPEVETLRRSLVQTIQGCVITKVSLSHRHRGVSDEALPVICGSQIEDIERLGKFLTFRIAFRHLVIHLGMSGRLLIRDAGTYRAGSHDHVRISTDDNRLLVFQDHRRFGRVFLSPLDLSALPAMGPDPLRDPMSASNLSDILGRRRAAIKVLLMEQSLIAGLGNIYASEILWAAGISPFRSGASLRLADYNHLAAAIEDVLHRAIAAGGATLDDYRGTSGQMGYFDASFAVYSRDGLKCLRCASQILAKTLANRVTYWCPGCQS